MQAETTQPAENVRERILAAAREEFAARGLDAASVHTIARRAGVTAAMINYYHGSKRALYDAVVAEAQGRLLVRLTEEMRGAGEPGTPGTPSRLAAAYFDFLASEGQLQRLLVRQVIDRDDSVRELTARFVRPLRAFLDRHFGTDEEALQLAISLFGAIAGYFLYEPVLGAFLGDDPLSPARLASRRRHVLRLAQMMERSR